MRKFKVQGSKLKLNGKLLSDSLIIYESETEVFLLLATKTKEGFSVCWSHGKQKEYPGTHLEELYHVTTEKEALKIIKGLERLADVLLTPVGENPQIDEAKNLYFERIK